MSVIGDVIAAVRAVREDVVVFVDNCYGEFAERLEPSAVGADLMAGSLIKNPGGGIAAISAAGRIWWNNAPIG